jgi:hypothetical protein
MFRFFGELCRLFLLLFDAVDERYLLDKRSLKSPFIGTFIHFEVCRPVPNPYPTLPMMPWMPSFERISLSLIKSSFSSSIDAL